MFSDVYVWWRVVDYAVKVCSLRHGESVVGAVPKEKVVHEGKPNHTILPAPQLLLSPTSRPHFTLLYAVRVKSQSSCCSTFGTRVPKLPFHHHLFSSL